jgi:uncharacterized membrane protein
MVFVALIVGVFFLFRKQELYKKAPFVLISSGWIYFFAVIYLLRPDIYFAFGALAVMLAITVFYATNNGSLPGVRTKHTRLILFALFAGTTLFIGVSTVYRYLNFSAPNFDFGIFSQVFEYMRTEGLPYTSSERDKLICHFEVHLSPVYYVILPFYMLFPNPVTLQVMQALIVASGIFPLYLICRHKKLPNIATVFIMITYAFYPPLSGGCMYDIHENMFQTAFALWLFYFIEKTDDTEKAWFGVFGFAALVFSIKENTPVDVACIALFVIFSKKKIQKGLMLLFFALFYFFLALWILKTFGEDIMADWRLGETFTQGGDMKGVVKNVVLNPAFVLKEIFSVDRIMYMLRMFVPLAFLPLVSKRGENFILFIPMILLNLIPQWPYHFDIGFQYNFGQCAILFYLFVINFSDLKSAKVKKFVLVFAMTASVFMFMTEMWPRQDIMKRYYENKERNEIISEVLSRVPEDVSVAASTWYVAHLYYVKILYEEGLTEHVTDYVVLNMRDGDAYEKLEKYQQRGYYVKEMEDGLIAVLVLDPNYIED